MSTSVGSLLPAAERPFGKYELIAKLATGGMAEIFLARRANSTDTELVVIKRVLPHLLDDRRFVAMFRDEARLAAQIVHPNVCQVFDSGPVGNTYFIGMEYLHGVPLSRLLLRAARTKTQVEVPLAVGLIIQCCHGLDHAHNLTSRDGKPLDVVHRDISPPNIFVTDDGLAKLLDFGVAKARGATQKTRTGTVKGKNSYMSPEQILGQLVDRRSDVFSLGIVLWETLAAERLFSRETDFMTFTAITEAQIPPIEEVRPEVGEALAAVVAKALARDRDERYSTAAELATALSDAVGGSDGYSSEQEVSADLRQRFSKELRAKESLTARAELIDMEATVQMELPPDELIIETAENPILADDTEQISIGLDQEPITHTGLVSGRAPRDYRTPAIVVMVMVSAILAGLLWTRDAPVPLASVAADAAQASLPLTADADIPVVVPDAQVPDAGKPDAGRVIRKLDTRPAYLTVDSTPWATIYVDGKKLGVTPIFKIKLKPGKHKLKAVSATGAKKVLQVRLKPGSTKNLGRLKW